MNIIKIVQRSFSVIVISTVVLVRICQNLKPIAV